MNTGYVKLWRKSISSTVFAHEGLWKLFCLCLLKAAHKRYQVIIPGILKPIDIEPGQFITGRYSLHEDYHQAHIKKKYSRKAAPTAYTLIRWLQNLQYMQILSIKSYNKYSIITVLNWERYQENEQQVSNRRASSEHKQEYNKNVKENTVDLYDFYIHEITPLRKSKQRAVSNIKSHLKNYSFEVLKQSILNYKTTCKDAAPQFRKDPANFFGKNEPYFKDFLPGNFQAQTDTVQQLFGEITQENKHELYAN